MSVAVPRHNSRAGSVDEDVAVLDRSLSWALEDLQDSSDAIGDALHTALTLAETRCAADPLAGNFETWDAWVTAMQTGAALFASATATEGDVQARIAHETRSVPATGPQSRADAGNWITTFWLTVICREKERMTALCHVPISLLRASGASYDEYVYAWVEALQAYWLGRGDFGEKLAAVARDTRPDAVEITDRELTSKIQWPPIELMHRFIRQDHAGFNGALADALRWHKEYWTADEARSMSSSGLVALAPLALACFAYDAGFPIDVESEYLPKALLERAWTGEFQT